METSHNENRMEQSTVEGDEVLHMENITVLIQTFNNTYLPCFG